LGVAQLERIDQIIERKRWMGHEYNRQLDGITGLQLPYEESWAKKCVLDYGIVLSGYRNGCSWFLPEA